MPTAIVLSHNWIAHELGVLEPWLEQNDFSLIRIYREEPRQLPPADLLIALGSPDSVAGKVCPPATAAEVAIVGDWLAQGRAYLGICFGAQVLARASGGSVTTLAQPFHRYTAMQTPHPWLAGNWVAYHNDAIAAPKHAQVLGRLDHADLAFRIGRATGIQPHIEVTPDVLERMLSAVGGDTGDTEEIDAIVAALAADPSHGLRAAALLDEIWLSANT